MTSALTVGSERSTWRMFADSETRRPPKTAPALEAAVPLGAMLTPLEGNVTEGRAARVVAKEENDVAVGNVDGVPEAPAVEAVVGSRVVLTLELKEGSGNPDDTDGDPDDTDDDPDDTDGDPDDTDDDPDVINDDPDDRDGDPLTDEVSPEI